MAPSAPGRAAQVALLAAAGAAALPACPPGEVPSRQGDCGAPREISLAGRPWWRKLPIAPGWFESNARFGQPGLPPDKLRAGEVPAGSVELYPLYVSVDPYLAGMMRASPAGTVPQTYAVVEVARCWEPCPYPAGTRLMGHFFWRESQIWPASALPRASPAREVLVLPEELPPKVRPSHYVGVLGMPGWTAYSGLFRIGRVTCPGETVLVSGAAGVTGAMAGQMAKILGCRVIGTAGTDDKVRHLKEVLGFDAALNYRTHGTVETMRAALSRAAPDGIDFYFDNTAGHVTSAAWPLLRDGARVAISGGIAHYFAEPSWWSHAVWWKDLPLEEDGSQPIGETPMGKGPVETVSRGRRIVVEALVWQGLQDAEPFDREFYERVPRWISEGRLKVDETVLAGFEKLPDAISGMFQGANLGKMVVHVDWVEGGDGAARPGAVADEL